MMTPSLEVAHNNNSSAPHHQEEVHNNDHDFTDAILKAGADEDDLEGGSGEQQQLHDHHHHHDGEDEDEEEEEPPDVVDVTESSETGNDPYLQQPLRDSSSPDGNGPNVINGEDWNHIIKPGTHDVLLGRGGGTNNHAGNIKFRKLVNEHKMRYLACSKVDKPKVARQVVTLWRKMDPTGRFLARKDETKRGPGSVKSSDNVWYEVGDKKAREKASQCLRERTPDVIPYIKHLRDQQNAITEQGVSMVQMQMQQQQQEQQQQQQHYGSSNNNNHNHMHHHSPHGPPHPGVVGGPMGSPHTAMSYGGGSNQNGGGFADPNSPYGAFPRRNSMPNQYQFSPNSRRGSLPSAPPMGSNFSPQAPTSNNGRRMPMGTQAGVPEFDGGDEFNHNNNNNNNNSGMHPADLSEMEYQQQMMMMQQNMMQQQLQMERLRQSRLHNRMTGAAQQCPSSAMNPGMNGGGAMRYNNNGSMPPPAAVMHHQQQQQQHGQQDHLDPLMVGSNPSAAAAAAPSDDKPAEKNTKRGRDDGDDNGSDDDDDEKPAAPDRTTSLMSLTPADPNSHELSLEDYRQQLEEYIANTNGNKQQQEDGGDESDLEDDWEKEREHAVRNQQASKNRGVNRNVSGMSMMSAKSGMSLVSGFSAFSDLNSGTKKDDRESKMNMTRSVGSNLSLMSELTDLSHNIDNLSIYDD